MMPVAPTPPVFSLTKCPVSPSRNITFRLHGRKLNGLFFPIRLKKGTGKEWLLIKGKD